MRGNEYVEKTPRLTHLSKGRNTFSIVQPSAGLIDILTIYKGDPAPDEPETTLQKSNDILLDQLDCLPIRHWDLVGAAS